MKSHEIEDRCPIPKGWIHIEVNNVHALANFSHSKGMGRTVLCLLNHILLYENIISEV